MRDVHREVYTIQSQIRFREFAELFMKQPGNSRVVST